MMHGVTNIGKHPQPILQRHRRVICIVRDRHRTGHQLHGKKRTRCRPAQPGRAGLVDLGDGRVMQTGEQFGLKAETSIAIRRVEALVQDLERHPTLGTLLNRLVNRRHATGPQDANDEVVANGVRERVPRCRGQLESGNAQE